MSRGNKNKPEEKANYSELNVNQREATSFVTRSILGLVMALLITFVSLFVIFNFVYPASSNNNNSSHALSSSTTYYKNGSSFYTRTSTTYYYCKNSSHSGTNKYSSSSSLSGTCYTTTTTCSTCNGNGYYYEEVSTRHSCSKTQSCSSCGGSGTIEVTCSTCGGRGALYETCTSCSGSGRIDCSSCGGSGNCSSCGGDGYTTGGWTGNTKYGCGSCGGSGGGVWGSAYTPGSGKCSSCGGAGSSSCSRCNGSGEMRTGMCSCSFGKVKEDCSSCSGSGSVNCSTCNGRGYYYTYEDERFSCSKTQTNSYKHSVSSYVEYTYTNIDTGSTTTSTSSYSTATGYTVSYNSNGGSGTMSSQYFLHGHSQALTANAFTRTNYKFKGWATSSSGSVTYTDKQSLNRSSGSNITLYANWELLSFTVTLDNQEATTAGTTSVTATNGQPMPSITVPTKTGYTFGGYYSGTNGGGTQYYTASGASARTCDLTGATTLYAKVDGLHILCKVQVKWW